MTYFEFDFFLLKKHYCNKCGELLIKKKVKRMIESKSEETYKYSIFEVPSGGDIKLTSYSLECPKCISAFTIKEQKEIEKEKRKRK